MKRHAFAKLTAGRTFRAVALTLVAVMVLEAPARAIAQAASAQPSTATKLANVPDSIPYEANPYSQVPQTRTMSTAIKEALENAGIDPREGSPSYDEAPTADTVTFEGQYPDGDVIVTGKLVNGRIVLTKQFKPVQPSGQLGDVVTIGYNPTPVTAGAPTLDPDSAALNSAIETELRSAYDDVLKQARALKGERIVSGVNIADGTLMFAVLTRNVYAFQLSTHMARLEHYANQPRAERIAHIQRLQVLAKRIRFWWAIRAFLTNALSTARPVGEIQTALRDKAKEAGTDADQARALLNMADRPEAWMNLASAEIYQLIDQDPIVAASGSLLRGLWSDERPEDLLEMYDDEVADAAVDAQSQLTRVSGVDTVEGITEFLRPEYARTRATAAMTLGRFSQNQYASTEAYAGSLKEVQGLARDPLGINTPLVIGGLIILSLVVPASMPLVWALLAAADVAAAGYALYHDVPYLINLTGSAANAREGRIVLGPDAFSKLSDEQEIVALGIVLSAFAVATGGRALTKAVADARAAEILRQAKARAAAARAAAGASGSARARGLSPEEVGYWVNRVPENATIGVAGQEIPARQYIRDSVLPEVDQYVGRARAAGVGDAQIAGVLKRARAKGPLDNGFAEGIEEELRIEEANSRGATILVDHSDYYFDRIESRMKGDFAEYVGGARPNSLQVVDLQEYTTIRTKMALEARGSPQTWTFEQAQIVRDEILPQGNRVKDWYLFEGGNADRGLEPMQFDDEFMATARALFGPTPSRIPRVAPPATPPPGSPGTASARTGGPPVAPPPVRGGDTAAGNLRRPGPNQPAPGPGDTQPPPDATTIDRGQTRIDPAQTTIDRPGRVIDPNQTRSDPGQTRIDPGQTRIDPGQTVVDPKLPIYKTPGRPASRPGAAMGAAGAGAAGASASGADYADAIPDGPAFAISGADKPKKTDSPLTTPIVTIRIDSTVSAKLNPAVINDAIRLVLMQYLAAEGQELTIPGASEPPKDLGVAPPIKIILTSLGRSSGDAFQMTVLNEGLAPVRLTGDAFVLEPVAGVTQSNIDRDLALSRGAGRATATLKAYCLELLKQPPTVGTVFRLAPEGVQRRFGNVGRILEATRTLRDAGKLRPGADDPSDPASYFDDIRQWAIWTQEQGFDERGYARAFSDHSRKNVEAAGHKWTPELEKAFTGLAAGRWQAVQAVLREAAVGR